MSISLLGISTSYATIPANTFTFSNNSYTIEFWVNRFEKSSEQFTYRIFSISNMLSLVIEFDNLYLWINNTKLGPLGSPGFFLNTWEHFSINRNGNNYLLYRNGLLFGAFTNSSTITQSSVFSIGNDSTPTNISAFRGFITNFRIVIGYAVYTSPYTVPTQPLTNISGTALLLLATNSKSLLTDSSSSPKTLTGNNVTWSSLSPFIIPQPNLWNSLSEFSAKNLQVTNNLIINGQQLSKVNINNSLISSNRILFVTIDSFTNSITATNSSSGFRTTNFIKYYNNSKIFVDAWFNVNKLTSTGTTNYPTFLRCDLRSAGGLITYSSRTILFFVEPRDFASSIANVKFYFDTTTPNIVPSGQLNLLFVAGKGNNQANTVSFTINSTTYTAGAPTNPASTIVIYEIDQS